MNIKYNLVGAGGLFFVSIIFSILLSFAEANVSAISDIASPAVFTTILLPVILQRWKDDSLEVKGKKSLMLSVWAALFVGFYTILIYLSGAHFLSLFFLLLFLFLVLAFIACIDFDKKNITIQEQDIKAIVVILLTATCVWTFCGTIELNAALNRIFHFSERDYILNINLFTAIVLGVPVWGMCFAAICGVVYIILTLFNGILFKFTDTIANPLHVFRITWKKIKTALPLPECIFFIVCAHIIAFLLGMYLSNRRDFVVYVTNFQICEVSYNFDDAHIILILAIFLSFVIGQKCLKIYFKENLSAKHITIYISLYLLLLFLLTIVHPIKNFKNTDPTDRLALELSKNDNLGGCNFHIKCPICRNDNPFIYRTNLFYINYERKILVCTQCEREWYIKTDETVKTILDVKRKKEEVSENICYRYRDLKKYPHWTDCNGNWKKCRQNFLKPYLEDPEYVKGYTSKNITMPEFIGDTLWIYSKDYDYPEPVQKLADSLEFVIKDCRLNAIHMAGYKGGRYYIIYHKE